MIHTRKEGEQVRFGFNLYHLNDKSSFGFLLKMYKNIHCFRYSKNLKQWIIY